jgi:ribosomal protein S18 acetylase RimI-like enzyme
VKWFGIDSLLPAPLIRPGKTFLRSRHPQAQSDSPDAYFVTGWFPVGQVTIRHGRLQDAQFLAWVILAASRGHLHRGWFDVALEKPENRCLEFLAELTHTLTPSLWHYSRFILVETEGQPVAALSAYPAAEAYPISPIAISESVEALGLPVAERIRIWERGEYAFNCTMPPGNDRWVIDNVAAVPERRGLGYTNRLLTHALELGRARGYREAQVTFLIGNDAAARAYERAGFTFANEWRHAAFEATAGSPGLQRFVRSL